MLVIQSKRNAKLDEGVWLSYQGGRVLIRHTSNSKFLRTMARLQAPFRKDIEKGRMDPDEMRNIVSEALAKDILLDWEAKDESGTVVKYNPTVGKTALLADEGLREFVQESASDLSNFRDAEIEEKGNI